MALLSDQFNELMERIRIGRDLDYAGFEPVYYLIFSPAYILDVKRQTPAWEARLRNEGWEVTVFSLADEITKALKEAKLREIWLKADSSDPLNWGKTNQALANYLNQGVLYQAFLDVLKRLENIENSILLVTDLEALHPYMRIGALEGKLQGEFSVPTIILYPGERTGKSRLKFLGFYPEDGNYRSVHVGG